MQFDRRRIIKDKAYRKRYNLYAVSQQYKWKGILSDCHSIHIADFEFNYIITPSFYDKVYQLTTFRSSDMLPLGHHTYNTIEELIQDNSFFWNRDPQIKETI